MQKKKSLLIIAAGVLWTVAGVNVFRIGWRVWQQDISQVTALYLLHWMYVLLTVLFFTFMFQRSYKRNTARISQMEKINHPLSFFDLKGWILIVFMIALGVSVRHFSLLPNGFIAPFYQGLGASLFVFGVRYLCRGLFCNMTPKID